MNCLMKAMILSLGLHGIVIFLVFALSSSIAQQDKPIVIDFDLAEPSNPPTPPTASPQKKANSPVIAKTHPLPSPPKRKSAPPKPASEPARMVPVFAKPGESIQPPAEQSSTATAKTMNGGSGTTGSNQTGGNSGSGSTGSNQSRGNSGTGNSGEKLTSTYRAEHFAYIKHIIEQNISYPKRAQRMGWTGRIVVSFDVLKNGHVQDIRIVKSSGYELLDSNLVETIRKVEPFPRPPVSVTLNMPITYELR
jgi:protein TonB